MGEAGKNWKCFVTGAPSLVPVNHCTQILIVSIFYYVVIVSVSSGPLRV